MTNIPKRYKSNIHLYFLVFLLTKEWKPSKHYKHVVGAIEQVYERIAHIYDENETCVVYERLQKVLTNDLDSILARIKKSSNKKSTSEISVLDACGGFGNVSLKLLEKKVNVTLCDISPELIKLFKDKCLDRGYTNYSTICQEIGEYLSKTTENFDLIVFSSASHHIEDYSSVLLLVANHLNTNGFIYTIFDNVKWQFPAFQIIWIDSILHALTKYPREFISAQIKKWKIENKLLYLKYLTDKDMQKYCYRSDLVVYVPISEPFGLIALKSISKKTPVVASKSGGISEIIRNRINGQSNQLR